MNPWHHRSLNSTPPSLENISLSSASSNNGLGPNRSLAANLAGEGATESSLWSHVLSTGSSNGNLSTDIFGSSACNYLKKLDGTWELSNNPTTPYNSLQKLQKQQMMDSCNERVVENERLADLSDLVSNWSIAPPQPQFDHQIAPNPSFDNRFLEPNYSKVKHEVTPPLAYSSYGHDMEMESQHQVYMTTRSPFLKQIHGDGIGYQIGLNDLISGVDNQYSGGVSAAQWSSPSNLNDHLVSFGGYVNKNLIDSQVSIIGLESPVSKKQGQESSSSNRGSARATSGTSDGRKKRSEDNSEALIKKSKLESPNPAPPTKLQTPKVKLVDKINALQQIVSPFGKTDTASVLFETINHIKLLHGEVQILSDPYMKSGAAKDKQERNVDLRSRGLCLVPTSSIPQVYHESSGPDYWTPTYRGFLYR